MRGSGERERERVREREAALQPETFHSLINLDHYVAIETLETLLYLSSLKTSI